MVIVLRIKYVIITEKKTQKQLFQLELCIMQGILL